MAESKGYLKKQFKLKMCGLQYETPADFYLGAWQTDRSPIPLLIIRALLFLGCVAIVAASMVINAQIDMLNKWPIYLTHWGLVMITVTTAWGVYVSAMAYHKDGIDDGFRLPWYIKTYWVLYNISKTIALLITVFYYAFLNGQVEFTEDIEINYESFRILDIFLHVVNTLIMMVFLISSRQPSRVMHVYQPILFALTYMVFSIIYYYAGGTDIMGNPWVYPMLDWANPGPTVIMAFATTILIILVHLLVLGISGARDLIFRTCRANSKIYRIP